MKIYGRLLNVINDYAQNQEPDVLLLAFEAISDAVYTIDYDNYKVSKMTNKVVAIELKSMATTLLFFLSKRLFCSVLCIVKCCKKSTARTLNEPHP